jgi:predicted Zn finger-like uncharacterized protein
MIITCPNCATRYEAPEESFEPDGRKVKCSNCRNTWFQTVGEAEVVSVFDTPAVADTAANVQREADKPLSIEEEAARLAAASRRASAGFASRQAMRRGSLVGWSTLAAVVCVFMAFGYWGRVEVVKLFPAAASIYAKIGLPVNVRGLEFANVRYLREFENGVPILNVTGEIINVTDEMLQVPRVRFGLYDVSQHEVYHWTMAIGREPLEPADAVTFSTRLAAPPEAAREVQIRFIESAS